MIHCPIAHWKKEQPFAKAFEDINYCEIDELVQKLSKGIENIPQQILAFCPKNTILDVAFFFAAWRMGKVVYPLSFRLPDAAIQTRLAQTRARWIELSQLPLHEKLEQTQIADTALATLIETSSATKIVCHPLSSHLISAKAAIDALHLEKSDSYCLNLPLFHVSGLATVLRAVMAGARLVSQDRIHEATHISMVPTQLYRQLQNSESLPLLKCLLVGGAPLSQSLYEKGLDQGYPIYISYGMTETASIAMVKTSTGKLTTLPHIEVKIDEEGEILVKGPSLFTGYFGKKPRDMHSWFRTGDLGQVTSTGIEIRGRKDRQFISGGENIQPEEIENVLMQIHGIIEARVEPQLDQEFGMRPLARLYTEQHLTSEEIQKKLGLILPRFKIPKEILIQNQPLSTKQAQLASIHKQTEESVFDYVGSH